MNDAPTNLSSFFPQLELPDYRFASDGSSQPLIETDRWRRPLDDLGGFAGAWAPSVVDSTHINLTAGSVSDGITTFTPTVTGISVHATSLNYVYLECDITPGETDDVITGGVITAAAIVAYTTTKANTNTKAYCLLCTWQASVVVSRFYWQSFGFQILDKGDATTTATSHFYT